MFVSHVFVDGLSCSALPPENMCHLTSSDTHCWRQASAGSGSQRRQLSVCGASHSGRKLRWGENWLQHGPAHWARKPVPTEVITCSKLNLNLMGRICTGMMMQDAVMSVQQYEHNCSVTGVFIHLPLPFILQMEMISSNFYSLNYLGKQF